MRKIVSKLLSVVISMFLIVNLIGANIFASEVKGETVFGKEQDKFVVTIHKKDEEGKHLPGAVSEIYQAKLDEDQKVIRDSDGKAIKGEVVENSEWISKDREHQIELAAGVYVVHEKTAPQNYEAAEDVEFEVSQDAEGGMYTLYEILNNYNAFCFGDVRAAHVIAPIVAKGNIDVEGGFADKPDAKPSYVGKELIGRTQAGGRIGNVSQIPFLYLGTDNEQAYRDCRKNNGGEIYYQPDYINFDKALEEIKVQAEKLEFGSVDIVTLLNTQEQMAFLSTDWETGKMQWNLNICGNLNIEIKNMDITKVTDKEGTVYYYADDSALDNVTEKETHTITAINLLGSSEQKINTVINMTQSETVNIPSAKLNGNNFQSAEGDKSDLACSVVFNVRNAKNIIAGINCKDFLGHIIAPEAEIETNCGNWSGCFIGKSVAPYKWMLSSGYMYKYCGKLLDIEKAGPVLSIFLLLISIQKEEMRELNVTKIWNDKEDQDGLRPKVIAIQLFADGVKSGEEVIISEEMDWNYKYDSLPKYQDGREIHYTVEEVMVPEGYESVITTEDNGNVV